MLLPLTSGAYSARSLIADAQTCENLFPELNPQETKPAAAVTHYPRPGLRPLSAPPTQGRGRGVFLASTGQLYAVVGPNAYYINGNWVWKLLGSLTIGISTPVSFIDNGITGVFVDGSGNGYTVTLATNTWNGIFVDSTGSFVGATRADIIDTFLIFNEPGSADWYSSLAGQMAFNALSNGSKAVYPDALMTLAANIDQVWLIGAQTSEIWYDAGNSPFPFAKFPNVFVPYGTSAPYSLVRADVNLFWLSRNKDGEVIAVKTNGYAVEAISTRALEARWTDFANVSDCIGYSYQQAGHTMVVWHFPSANESWGYDLSTQQWHKRTWIDGNGVRHRERVAFHAFVDARSGYPQTNVGQDWQTGQIYAIDQNMFMDNTSPILHVRSFPHLVDELHYETPTAFVADFETGSTPNTTAQVDSAWSSGFSSGFGPFTKVEEPFLMFRYSKTGGRQWSNYRRKGLISGGNYRSMMRWRGLGMGRDFVFELTWSAPLRTALQQAFVDVVKHAA